MQISVLGATEVWRDGLRVDLGTRKRRALVAALALAAGRPVPVDAVVEMLWPDGAPAGVAGTLQAYVSGLRRALEPERAPRAVATVLVTTPTGYALQVEPDALDATRFERTVGEVHRVLGGGALWQVLSTSPDVLGRAVGALEAALALWRGDPYAELGDVPAAAPERARLEELRTVAVEDRARARLALGDHGSVAAELEALTAAYPFRERLWGLRALALARGGRQADALGVLREVREVLADELGLEPSAELREVQAAVLRQDAELVSPPTREPSAPVPARPPGAARFTPMLPPWPMVGRDVQLASLVGQLDQADEGTPGFAAVTGDPGIGKSRLCAELGGTAVRRGARVVVGRCTQEPGAPPLWPWQQVLRWLDEDLDVAASDEDDPEAEFRVWESVVDRVVAAAQTETLVVLLEDLHWADAGSLRVLRLLAESVHTARLLVLGTWRRHPEPTDALADVAETFARRHATRLELEGLDAAGASAVMTAVAELTPSLEQAGVLATRTDGNPFFLVEYARLASDGGDLTRLMAESDPPTAVSDVLERRLARLPEPTLAVLRRAAVLGRFFELDDLVAIADTDEDAVLDDLDAAIEAGLVREDDVGRFRFAHALVRDQIYASLSPTRRAREHARAAAMVAPQPGRESETARHWLAAGPAHAPAAWRAARKAAGVARRLHAHTSAAELLEAALDRAAQDPEAGAQTRFELLMELADAQRWRGSWDDVLQAVELAIAAADELADVRLLARAAASMTVGAMWQSSQHGVVNESLVAALRRALAGLPSDDDELRCRAMLGLASELYYADATAERAALIDEALAMARRIGDDGLLLEACQVGYVAQWRPETAEHRLGLAQEAMAIAERTGSERSWVVAATLAAVTLGELGKVTEMWSVSERARVEAERLHLAFSQVVLDTLQLPWHAMAGRFDEAESRLASITGLAQRMRMPQVEDAVAGAWVTLRLWQGRAGELMPLMEALESGPMPVTATLVVVLLRSGLTAEARAHAAAHPIDLAGDDWFSLLNWAAAAEAALALADRDLAAGAYARLAPFEGRAAVAGSGNAMGPVDAFLALAAAAVGDGDLAARHADRAEELVEAWQIPLAAQWLRDQRDRHRF